MITDRYETADFVVITLNPKDGNLLSDATLAGIKGLKADLLELAFVDSVTSILDVPLLESPRKPIKELLANVPSLETQPVDRGLAKTEFLDSPVYQEMLVSPDFSTTLLQVNLKENKQWKLLVNRRYALREKQREQGLTTAEEIELGQLQAEFKGVRNQARDDIHQTIQDVRAVIDRHRDIGTLFLGGVDMIADDMITYVKNDLAVFGTGVLLFLVITLGVIFRQFIWVFLPMLTCFASVVATAGLLGLFGWEVTVISSNFVSIQLIITMALTIHLIVRYRELISADPTKSQRQLVEETVLFLAKPCFYMVITTMAGFASLLLSGILPVINFGWMMAGGLAISMFLTFWFFPTILVMLKPVRANRAFETKSFYTRKMAELTEHKTKLILVVSGLLLVWCVVGTGMLRVENSFIDYFKEKSEIYQGMKVIDQELGGTTPFEVVLDLPSTKTAGPDVDADGAEPSSELDLFEEEFEAEKGKAQYWFTSDKMAQIERVHDYLNSVPETGKVMSLGTMIKVGKRLNDGEPLDNFKLALIYNELPPQFRKILLDPYVSIENDQVRFYVRVRDSEPGLRRDELLKRIKRDLPGATGVAPEQVHLTGLLVLYNNMLQSLFNSQILSLGATILAIMAMFLVLFRSVKISLVAILPNVLSIGMVLGFMGWVGIPLDMMTITIASISVGIAVDDTIHYIHRFKEELQLDGDYLATMHRCHESIGYAMYYTSVTIVIGFSILVLSAFIPTIYFGLLTGLAMVIANITALTVLPSLILYWKPFGETKVA